MLPCRLVVAADGANSRVRQLAGLRTWGWGYGQRGLVATVETDGGCTGGTCHPKRGWRREGGRPASWHVHQWGAQPRDFEVLQSAQTAPELLALSTRVSARARSPPSACASAPVRAPSLHSWAPPPQVYCHIARALSYEHSVLPLPPVPNTTAWQRFLPTGPLALLPVRGGRSNVVWSTTPDAARALEGTSPAEFAAAVNKVKRRGSRVIVLWADVWKNALMGTEYGRRGPRRRSRRWGAGAGGYRRAAKWKDRKPVGLLESDVGAVGATLGVH